MIPLAAYCDRLSVRPGQTIRFHCANATAQAVNATLVRVVCADPNPVGPGIITEPVDAELKTLASPGLQSVPQGSYMRTPDLPAQMTQGGFSLYCRVQPTYFREADQIILSLLDEHGAQALCLGVDSEGYLFGEVTGGLRLRLEAPLRLGHWAQVWLRLDEQGNLQIGRVRISATLTDGGPMLQRCANTARATGPLGSMLVGAGRIGAANGHFDAHFDAHFDGRVEGPAFYERAFEQSDLREMEAGNAPADAAACWDFSQAVASSTVRDCGSYGLHGVTVNSPARAMRSSTWRGVDMCFSQAPGEYAAAHLHSDDIDDCCWPAAFEWQVPEDTRSSCYALILQAGDVRENVPFFVVAPKGRASAKLAVLVSTFTYTVYGNSRRREWDDPAWRKSWEEQSALWGAYPYNPAAHEEYGLSTYNRHPDATGIAIASWHRPMLNVRVGYITFANPEIRGSGLRHLPADSHLLAWLEQQDIEYDLVSDWELHHEGVSAISDYRVLLTGSHPEYHTRQTLDALESYRDQGGRLCYLGGNGFYWKVALSEEKPGVIEIRRGEGGIRAWAADPGEYYNQFDGEYGGLWRRNGRAPQRLAGVGFTAQGGFVGSYYRKCEAAEDPRVAWMFAGVSGEVLGDHGLSGCGAAGFELDRVDYQLGTPENALVVAKSEGHDPDAPWVLVPEDILNPATTWSGDPAAELIRADMTFFETPAGGAVFSTGSITYCGSLLTDTSQNDISKLTLNVIERFLDPTPFEMPSASWSNTGRTADE